MVMDKDKKEQEQSHEGVSHTNTGNHADQNAPASGTGIADRQEGEMDNGELGGNFRENPTGKQQEKAS